MPRFFNLLEAESLIPEVERDIRRLIEMKKEMQEADQGISEFKHRVVMAGGMLPRRDLVIDLRGRRERAIETLKATLQKLTDSGCHLKDIEMGLIDFPTLYRGEEVYLCWKFGESGIRFWHPIEDGYRGRRLVDSEFLANHRGDPAH